ncbi:methyltransferase domain-containing protein [Paenibacillus sp. SYP-B3998]|uniref:Methyltransferase domain-containing protein n=1 Tax=Paenibacillus sp. SYP-B3998 TaxID=2678564 RepID=A0A6G4A458_9BACL|nr:methyltransferase domain-containing protein [Paenibacillus sp. SYP-B3998]NEW09253.1 methyltransferase domain-containing protein [Paenibacillus sp. SYP-B3998]
MASDQYLMFLQKFIQNPKQIGSVLPSSRFLANKMVQSVPWSEVGSVAELGSGTGAVTRFIKSSVSDSTKVFLFENDETMKANLQKQYPSFACHTNACYLTNVINHHGIHQLDCIISGLPFFNFPRELRETLIDQIIKALKPGGYFVAFQYSLQMKKHLVSAFDIERINLVPLNFPPAFVYVCRKKGGIA